MNILYYDGNDKNKRQLVKAVLDQFPYPYTIIETQQGNETLATLLGIDDHTNKETDKTLPDLDIMIFHEIDDESITAISATLRQQHAHVERKCIVTEHNQSWKLVDLLAEITKEHAYYQSFNQCYELIKEVHLKSADDYTPTSWQAYQNAFMNAYLLLQETQPTKAQLDHAISEIIQTKAQLILK